MKEGKYGLRWIPPRSARPTAPPGYGKPTNPDRSFLAARRTSRPSAACCSTPTIPWAFLLAGFCECVDTFFAFGLFALAKRSGFFPPELVDTFEPVVQEEGRHILFFVNWVAWHRRNLPALRRVLFGAKILSVWAYLIWERIGIARGIDGAGGAKAGTEPQDNNFVFSGSKAIGSGNVSAAAVIDVCMSEHERRFSGYDPRLLRPDVMPRAMRFVRRFMRP